MTDIGVREIRLATLFLVICLLCTACPTTPPPIGPQEDSRIAITSPTPNSNVAGPTFFSVQLLDPAFFNHVRFLAGERELVPELPGENETRVFLLPQRYNDGPLTLTAIAEGVDGKKYRSSVSVNIMSNPPSETTVTESGATLGAMEANGAMSVLTVPKGVLPGTRITFEARTQDEIRDRTGVDYEALGLTFLGAQEFQSDSPIDTSISVSSGGFGPRVQPGQIVVNYSILPDADGDGVGEVVVINNAVVAPNGDVISEPVPGVLTADMASVTESSGLRTYATDAISVMPGAAIEIAVAGLNPYSHTSNVAVFVSSSAGKFGVSRVILSTDPSGGQTARAFVPNIPPGSVDVAFVNVTTGTVSEPMTITVLSPAPLGRPIQDVFLEYFDRLEARITDLPEMGNKAGVLAELQLMRDSIDDLTDGAAPDVLEQFEVAAQMLQQGMNFVDATLSLSPSADITWRTSLEVVELLLTIGGLVGGATAAPILGGLAVTLSLSFIAYDLYNGRFDDPFGETHTIVSTPFDVAKSLNTVAEITPILERWTKWLGWTGVAISSFVLAKDIFDSVTDPPLPPSGSPGSPVGMGGAPPQGGPGVGNIVAPMGLPQPGLRVISEDPIAGRFTIKFMVGGASLPFTGAVDAAGYFYLPGLPNSQPFTAVARDGVTGAIRTVDGVGKPPDEPVFLSFNFLQESDEPPVQPVALNSTVSAAVPAGGSQLYSFEAEAGQLVRFGLFTEVDNPGFFSGVGLTVFDPTGELFVTTGNIAQYSHFQRTFPTEIEVTGTYLLSIGNALKQDVAYSVGLVELLDPVAVEGDSEGLRISDSIDVLYGINAVAFEAPNFGAAAKLLVSVPNNSDLIAEARVISPSGSTWHVGNAGGGWGDLAETIPLLEVGWYTLEVEGSITSTLESYSGAYDAELFVASAQPTPLAQNVHGYLSADQIAVHSVESDTVGTFAAVAFLQPDGETTAEVYAMGPLGALPTHWLSSDRSISYGFSGTGELSDIVSLVINNLRTVGLQYEIAISPLPDPIFLDRTSQTLTAEGGLDVIGEVIRYSFIGEAGEVVRITLRHPPGDALNASATFGLAAADGLLTTRLGQLRTDTVSRSETILIPLPQDDEYVIDVNVGGYIKVTEYFDNISQVLGDFEIEIAFE